MELVREKGGPLDRGLVVAKAREVAEVVLFNSQAATEQRIVDLVTEAFYAGSDYAREVG
jgi:hypothetical protein